MRRAGFIDIQNGWNGNEALTVHVFGYRAGGFEREKSVNVAPSSSAVNELGEINEFYLSLPLRLLNFRIMRFPFSDRQKLKDVIPFELDGLILGGSESVVFDPIVLGKSGNDFDVLVAYAEKKALGEILTKLTTIGIDPQVVTSVELQSVVAKGNGDIAVNLMSSSSPGFDERIEAAKKELSAHTLNLRTGTFAYTKDAERITRSFKVTALLLLLLLLVINSDLFLRVITAKREASAVRSEIRSLYAGLFPDDKKITDELYQTKSHMKELQERETVVSGVFPLRFLRDLSQRTVQDAKFDEINLEREIVTMRGEALSLESVDKMKTKLWEFLKDVSVSDVKSSVEGKVRFTIVAKVRTL